jgi:HK97 gp10 family phage protein
MRVTSTSHVSGLADLERAMLALSKDVATKIGASAIRKGAKIQQWAVIAAAPDGPTPEGAPQGKTGRPHLKIKNNVKVRKGRSKNSESVSMLVNVDAFQSVFIERGTVHMQAQPFAARAIEASHQDALNAVIETLEKGIARANRNSTTP